MSAVSVKMLAKVPCAVCGYGQQVIRFSHVTVLAKTLREGAPTLCWGMGRCDECGWAGDVRCSFTTRYQLGAEDWAKVAAIRARRRKPKQAAA